MPDTAPDHVTLSAIADTLDARRERILAEWRAAVDADPTLDAASDWTVKQFNDHFPDVLEALGEALRSWPQLPVAQARDERDYAVAHARTRWLQGYSLRGLVREWGHFNAVVVDHLADCAPSRAAGDHDLLRTASAVWCRLLGDQQALSVLEYQDLERAGAETRSAELQRLLDVLRSESATRGRALEVLASDMRNELQLVMTSHSLHQDGAGWHQAYELRRLSDGAFRGLERALSDMVTLANLEAGLERRQLARFDAGHGLELLVEGLRHVLADQDIALHGEGPAAFAVEGDAERVRRLAAHLIGCASRAPAARAVRLHWGADAQVAARWQLVVEQVLDPAPTAEGTALGRELAAATGSAQQAAGVAPTGLESAIQRGAIPVAAGDGIDLLIAKHLCELLGASLEVEAEAGLVRYRASLPASYDELR